ncbi:hypothetical protein [Variovorax saccharolyticus]|uniref:hypothetical protein n=1 Tax=Variovorax saccharolyticus TaxID=3053516 RepID=UPI002574CCBD|nr:MULTISPECIES: hypothetical protein [unclassified Variovorax]MDM0018214.1 hypothetical protein [Variovorax sp. J22R187]MDM0024594.1 hypothetical protein [Variovorax sp. J31P216]
MRRLVFIFLMVVLPIQWTWAAAASVCAHEPQGASHFGHHQHEHADAAQAVQPADEGPAGSLSNHPDCGVCHAAATAVVPASESVPTLWGGHAYSVRYAWAVPDRFVDTLLRPPSALVA